MIKRIAIWTGIVILLLAVAAGVLLLMITQPVLPGTHSGSVVSVGPERLEEHVTTLLERFNPRDELHPENLDSAAVYIAKQFRAAGGRVSEQPYEVNGHTYRNVVATFGRETSDRIIVGAHYDTAGPLPGADDNASGVAGLLELATLLGRSVLPMTIELVAFTLEEPPHFRTEFMGSRVHARSMVDRDLSVRLMISLEMIGYFSDEENSQMLPSPVIRPFYPSAGNFIAVVGRFGLGGEVRMVKKAMRSASDLPVYSICAPPSLVRGVDFSDHLNYWNAGFDAVMITDTAFFRNPNYHTEHDTPDSIDFEKMAQVVEGVYAAVIAAAE